LVRRKASKFANQFGVRDSEHVLSIENAGCKEFGLYGRLESRPAGAGRVTSVTNARSIGPAGMLKTTHGRTFPTIPRSTIQTSPRLGTGIYRFLRVKLTEQGVRSFEKRVFGQFLFEWRHATQYLNSGFMTLGVREGVERCK
jgi:hypothetical protein